MDSEVKCFAIVATTLIICASCLICLNMVHGHTQTLKYIESGYSQQQTNVGMRWVKE